MNRLRYTSLTLAAGVLSMAGSAAQADQVFNDDVIVGFSLCVGNDCVNGESFGFDTIRLKENNLRIKFQDTSTSASFPSNDWQITINDSSNGGANYFRIEDIDGGRQPFTIEASAPSHSLYVDDGGRIGVGTNTPVVEVHVKDGDTPTVRLEQDGSSGFTPQTWDLAGNEANFFLRDVTNGSKLPFKVRPNAPTDSIDVRTNGVSIGTSLGIGTGTSGPDSAFEIERGGAGDAGLPRISLNNLDFDNPSTGDDTDWVVDVNDAGVFRISLDASGGAEFALDTGGNLTLTGTVTAPSSRHFKSGIVEVDAMDVLDKLDAMPIVTWNYNHQSVEKRHMGPIAEDFYAAFGLGTDEQYVTVTDLSGVALAAIKALSQQNAELRARLETLENRVAD